MKKLLALVLALVMSMSLVTISNADFKDADKIDGKDLQLLVEADLIAGCTEEDDPSAHAKAVRRLFKSASGLALLDTFIKE